ncbi:MAG: hypothetical protein ACYC3S_10530 [Chloroflexota bacterium]
MRETVLVTGGNGFVWGYICRHLVESGRRVVLVDMVPASPPRQFVQGPYGEDIRYTATRYTATA